MLADHTLGSTGAIEITEAASIVPDRSIDLDQVCRTSGNNPEIIRQMLSLFDAQADLLLALMARETPKNAAARAHTLATSARTLGAWKVAELATAFEEVALDSTPVMLSSAMNQLSAAVTDAQAEIASILSYARSSHAGYALAF
jgi:HPt (histidine-containing phosphotransfer) domain-containing protein